MPVRDSCFVGHSRAIQHVRGLVEKAARTPTATVLARGESGTGKALIARAIHIASTRSNEPFVSVTCSALGDALLDGELFGLLELAGGGTVLLDEIGDMTPTMQARLLSVLEAQTFRRADGGGPDIKTDFRIISCTKLSFEHLTVGRQFREDLYYRLNTVTIEVPPLRDRREDVAMLTDHFLARFARELAREVSTISDEARDKLRAYDWPGNVRELRGVIERAVTFGPAQALSAHDVVLGRSGRSLVASPTLDGSPPSHQSGPTLARPA